MQYVTAEDIYIMNQYDCEKIDNFFSTIEPWKGAYTNVGFSFFAVRRNDGFYLLQARLFLNVAASAIPAMRVETPSIIAGHMALSELRFDVRQFVDAIANEGMVTTPIGTFIFPTSEHRSISAYFDPFHQEGIAVGNRLPVLTISGESKHTFTDSLKFDWELKAQPQPFDSVDELLWLFMLGGKVSDSVMIEVVANTVAIVNQSSSVSGGSGSPCITLAKNLDRNKCRIGYREFLHGKVVSRGSIEGHQLEWNEQDGFLLGKGWVGVSEGAVLHCFASYGDHAQNQGWVADPAHSQNARRVCIEVSDEKLEILRDYLFEEQKARKNSRDFESGVASLMWMLGFNVNQVGGTARTSDAPDILATSPQGNILIVECTVGLLKAENKLATLIERTEAIKKRLSASGNGHLKVLPIIVTAKTNDEIKADIEQAQKLDIVVVTRETLIGLMQQTIAVPDPEAIYMNAWNEAQPRKNLFGV